MIHELRFASGSQEHSFTIKIALVYAALNDKDMALGLLQEAIERREPDVTAIPFDPRWKKLRDEPRFRRLVKAIGLSEQKI